jgi:hypothetical protein
MQFQYEVDTNFVANIIPKTFDIAIIGDAGSIQGTPMITVGFKLWCSYNASQDMPVDDILIIQGTRIVPRALMSPLALNDKTTLNNAFATFEWGGILSGFVLKIK